MGVLIDLVRHATIGTIALRRHAERHCSIPDLAASPLRVEIDQGIGALQALAQRLRQAGDAALLDYLQQQLFVLGAQIGEGLDDMSGAPPPGDAALQEDDPVQ